MAITFIDDSSDANNAAAASIVVPALTGVADGDVLVGIIGMIGQPTITGTPSGWTLLNQADQGSNVRSAAYYKVASSESGSYTWTTSASFKGFGWVGCFRGAVTDPPIADWASATGTSGTSHVCPTVTVPTNGVLISAVQARFATTGVVTTWTDTDTERFDNGSSTGAQDTTAAVYTSTLLAAGDYGRTLTSSQSLSQLVLWSIALAPAAEPAVGAGWNTGIPIFGSALLGEFVLGASPLG